MDSQSGRLDYARGAMTQSPSMCARHCCTLASQHWPVLLYLYFKLNFRLVFWELESMFAEELTTLGQHMQLLRWQLFGLKIISMNNHNCLKIISKNHHNSHSSWASACPSWRLWTLSLVFGKPSLICSCQGECWQCLWCRLCWRCLCCLGCWRCWRWCQVERHFKD